MKKFVKIIILFSIITIFFYIMIPTKAYARTLWDVLHQDRIYKEPGVNNGSSTGDDLEGLIQDAEDFENTDGESLGTEGSIFGPAKQGASLKLNTGNLKNMSSNMYTIFLIVATAICVIVGMILGVKFVYGSIEAQVEVKKLLKPYLIGCVVIFGAFGIWNLAVNIIASV